MATIGGHNLAKRPYGKYVKKSSSQEPLDGLKPHLAEMFLAKFLSGVITFCSDRPPFKMAAVTENRNVLNCPLLL
jgi:hypothetical protein